MLLMLHRFISTSRDWLQPIVQVDNYDLYIFKYTCAYVLGICGYPNLHFR